MKNFKAYLLEQTFTVKQAEDFMGLSGKSWTQDDLETAYRHLAMKMHPDRGGSLEDMKKLNMAKKILKQKGPSTPNASGFNMDFDMIRQHVLQDLNTKIHEDDFLRYFKKIFPTNTFEVSRKDFNSVHGINIDYTFQNKRKDKLFTFSVYVDLNEAKKASNTLSNSPSISYPLIVSAYGYRDKKKIKVFSKNWKSTVNHDDLKPEMLFPKSKITKNQVRKFAKRDMVLFIEKELNGKLVGKDLWFVPTKTKNLYMKLFRSTYNRQAAISVYGLHEKTDRGYVQKHLIITTYAESLNAANRLKELSKMTESKLVKELEKDKKERNWYE